uniref:Polyprotein n=1 Tax=Guarapuava tymovirus-like 2 TaxID=2487753 RepID=A0A3G4YID9_9VIRU|nr:polyprotein [Guarapuava tymovirus-like 2]
MPTWLHAVKSWIRRHPWLLACATACVGASSLAALAASIQLLAPVAIPALILAGISAVFFFSGRLLNKLRAQRLRAYVDFLFRRDFLLSFETEEILASPPHFSSAPPLSFPSDLDPTPPADSEHALSLKPPPSVQDTTLIGANDPELSTRLSELEQEFLEAPIPSSSPLSLPNSSQPPPSSQRLRSSSLPSDPPTAFRRRRESLPSGFAYGPNSEVVVNINGVMPASPRPRPAEDLLSDVSEGPVLRHAWEHLGLLRAAPELDFRFGARVSPCTLPIPNHNVCLFDSLRATSHKTFAEMWEALSILPDSLLDNPDIRTHGFDTRHLAVIAHRLRFRVRVWSTEHNYFLMLGPESDSLPCYDIIHEPGHFRAAHPGEIERLERKNRPPLARRPKPPPGQYHSFVPDPDRAKNLCRNMRSGCEGVLRELDLNGQHGRDFLDSLDRLLDVARARGARRSVTLEYIAGVAGSGKSWPVAQRLLHRTSQDFRIVVPTHNLRGEWYEKLLQKKVKPYQVSTWEKALLHHAQLVILDELPKMPRGYLDLCILADPSVRKVIILADPAQVEYHPLHPDSTNPQIQPTCSVIRPYLTEYCMTTRRVPNRIARSLGIRSSRGVEGFVEQRVPTAQDYAKGAIVLVNSHSTAKTLASNGVPCRTIAGSQGLTVDAPVFIHLSDSTRFLPPSAQYVALTRSTKGVYFFGDLSFLSSGSSLFRDVYSGVQRNFFDIFPELHGVRVVDHFTLQGAGEPTLFGPNKLDPEYAEDVIVGERVQETTPFRAAVLHLPPSRLPLHQDLEILAPTPPELQSADPTPTYVEPVIPHVDYTALASCFAPEPYDPFSKEIMFRGEFSRQFVDLNDARLVAPQSLRTIAANHSEKKDPTLLKASITKRLRFRQSSRPYRFTDNDHSLSFLLISSYSSFYGINPNTVLPFDPDLYARCIAENEFAQLTNKTQKVIMANAERSDPDWRWSVVRIFSKTQHKVNQSTLFGSWKACQTLALMHDAVILLLGPVKKYQRAKEKEIRPPNLYVHAGQTPSQLSKFCQEHLRSTKSCSNDYTAFDQSQHGEAVLFEIWKMQRLSIPPALIDLHRWIKTNVTTQFGPLTCMRLTGEPGTYDDNSDYNLAVLALRYSLSSSHTVFVSGDDSAIFPPPQENPGWLSAQPLLHLQFKTSVQQHTLFCGYYLGPAGAARDPLALFAKLAIALDTDDLSERLLSHLAEFSTGHALGDSVFSLFPPDLSEYHCAAYQLFCQRCSQVQKLVLRAPGTPISSISKSITSKSKLSWRAYQILRELDPSFTHPLHEAPY